MILGKNLKIRWIISIVILLFGVSHAVCQDYRGGEIFKINGSDVYWAAVKTEYFCDYVARQEEDCWCWAACVQMVLNYQGVAVQQEDLVCRVKGMRVNQGGTAYDIQKAANGWMVNGKQIIAKVENSNALSAQIIINDLVDKYPLIIGLRMPGQSMGHAYVLTGISFRMINGNCYPIEIIVRNPWPSSPSREKFQWDDFLNRVHTIVRVYPG